jgi:hypothetical protein
MPYIFYNGIGANTSEIHSVEEFLHIMKHAETHYYEMSFYGFNMEYKNYCLPADFINFTLEEWIDYSGAEYYDSDY